MLQTATPNSARCAPLKQIPTRVGVGYNLSDVTALQPAVDEFLADIKSAEHASVNTYLAYKSDLAQLVAYLDGMLLEDAVWDAVEQPHLDGFIGQLQTSGFSKATVARKIAAARALFRWLADRSLILDNPLRRMKLPRLEKRTPHTVTEHEVDRLIEAAGDTPSPRVLRDKALLAVLYGTGMRVSEVIAVKLSELQLHEGWIMCITRVNRTRRIPIHGHAIQLLQEYLDNARGVLIGSVPTDVVFLNPSGGGLTRQAVWIMIKNYARQAGIAGAVTPHTLRHSRAAHMLHSGEDVHRVKEWLGHANLSTTQAYVPRPVEHAPTPVAGDLTFTNTTQETATLVPSSDG